MNFLYKGEYLLYAVLIFLTCVLYLEYGVSVIIRHNKILKKNFFFQNYNSIYAPPHSMPNLLSIRYTIIVSYAIAQKQLATKATKYMYMYA